MSLPQPHRLNERERLQCLLNTTAACSVSLKLGSFCCKVEKRVVEDFTSRIWMTYRWDFPILGTSVIMLQVKSVLMLPSLQ